MIDIVGRQKTWFGISGAAIAAGLVAMVVSFAMLGAPLRLGLDFTGGTLLQLEFEQPVTAEQVRAALTEEGAGSSSVVQIDRANPQTALIRTPPIAREEQSRIEATLRETVGEFRRDRDETVGPTIGATLLQAGLLSLFVAFTAIIVYVGFRFQFDYAAFAIAALFHDVAIVTGLFAILGLVVGVEVDSLFIVALLTIVGFSVNDTVVIYDRIRENSRKMLSRKVTFAEVVNVSVNQTLGRSVNTSLTSVLALLAIFLFGGATLRYFSLALLLGFICGTYSSIFIASTLLVWWRDRQGGSGTLALADELDDKTSDERTVTEGDARPDASGA
ncbi:MAG: protein translocase subunit SecF [Cyanobacteria bacterium J06648_11]